MMKKLSVYFLFLYGCSHISFAAVRSVSDLALDANHGDGVNEVVLSEDTVTVSSNMEIRGRLMVGFEEVKDDGMIGEVNTVLADTRSSSISLQLPEASSGKELRIKKIVDEHEVILTHYKEVGDKVIIEEGERGYVQLFSDGEQWHCLDGYGFHEDWYDALEHPIFWMPMNGNLMDSGQGLSPKWSGANLYYVNDASGASSKALALDGEWSNVTFDYESVFAPSSNTISFCMWFQIPDLDTESSDVYNDSVTLYRLYDSAIGGDSGRDVYELTVVASTGVLRMSGANIDNINGNFPVSTIKTTSLSGPADQWYFCVVTCSDTMLTYYLYGNTDGNYLKGEYKSFTGFPHFVGFDTMEDARFRIGHPSGSALHADKAHDKVNLDDFRIYDFTLTESQVQELYESGPQ